MKVKGQADKKRALLDEVARIEGVKALDAAIAAAADREVAREARAAAGRIAQALMAPQQPPYVRRSAFMRWVAC